ncbi:sodium-dependent glucose transporter 1-like isoform X2 [Brevipalpus obovatus]|uniref:sodium-dependent glucose transporter 1-like isoform X2 n=1 Tax=Brevipalpus obovatus TaxID=246614 RepID=UPI003D9F2B73
MWLPSYIRDHRSQLLITFITSLGFITFAFRFASTGASLLDLQVQIQESFSVTSWLVTSHSIGYMLGACLARFLEELCDMYVTQAMTSILGGLAMFLVPLFSNKYLVFSILLVNGIANGIFETVSYVVIGNAWREKVGNYMQMLFASFGIGGLLAPAVMRQFQLPMPEEALENPDIYLNLFKPEEVQIKYPFFGVAIASGAVGIAFLFYHEHMNNNNNVERKDQESGKQQEQKMEQDAKKDEISSCKIAISVAWVGMLGHLGFGMQLVFGTFAQAYGVKSSLRMDKKDAALIATTYWIFLSASHICFILFTLIANEKILTIICTSMLSIGVIICFTLASTFEVCYWLVAMCLGLGFGPLFIVAYADLEKYFHLTGKHASCICIVFVLGESIHVPIVGEFMEEYPDLFLYYCATLGTLFVTVFISFPYVCKLLFGDREDSTPLQRNKSHQAFSS